MTAESELGGSDFLRSKLRRQNDFCFLWAGLDREGGAFLDLA